MAAPLTPLMEQYRNVKQAHQDAVLFFRLGDFYEMFGSDAIEVSALLDLTLTQRNGEPMCGIPYHASRSYLGRLVKLGKKVAICEQTTPPGKGIIERKVVEVVTPGTVLESEFLDSRRNNFILSIASASPGSAVARRLSLSAIDISTGDFRLTALACESGQAELRRELFRYQPREILVQQTLLETTDIAEALAEIPSLVVNRHPDWHYDRERCQSALLDLFGVRSLKAWGLEELDPAISSTGVLVQYLRDSSQGTLKHVAGIDFYSNDTALGIDEATQRNLEIAQNSRDAGKKYSLLEAMDETRTGMGARLLRERLLRPLRDRKAIEARLDEVEAFCRDSDALDRGRAILARIQDLERLAARVAMERAHARDLVALRESLYRALEADELFSKAGMKGLFADEDERNRARATGELIERTLLDEPAIPTGEGGMVRPGFNAELDGLFALRDDSERILGDYLESERARTGIPSLKIRQNNLIGYFLEINRSHAESVPADFIRKQSMATAERFTTATLIDLEKRISSARDRIVELERSLFIELRDALKPAIPFFKSVAAAVAGRDVASALAFQAMRRAWTRPRLSDEPVIRIKEGRHPVVEAWIQDGTFIPNDLSLGAGEGSFALITGPNMAGKSTFLRQTALITIMAQAGSFVPALDAELGTVDRVFCRVGAQDNIARGESTFLVEMNETAYILNAATERSLVIMDEVGRGTSTVDGLAIARAVAEDLLGRVRARCLFATHYHELSELVHERIVKLRLDVLETDEDIVFLKKVVPGSATSSYGLHAARLAGLPSRVLARASEIQDGLLAAERQMSGKGGISGGDCTAPAPESGAKPPKAMTAAAQSDLFPGSEYVIDDIKSINLEETSPLEALNRLSRWKKLLSS